MANEFIIKNGFHSKGDSQITGSLDLEGIGNVSASIAAKAEGTILYEAGSGAGTIQPNINSNSATGACANIGGGKDNIASGLHSVVAGGCGNKAIARHSSVLGGTGNCACATGSVVLGGESNTTQDCEQ